MKRPCFVVVACVATVTLLLFHLPGWWIPSHANQRFPVYPGGGAEPIFLPLAFGQNATCKVAHKDDAEQDDRLGELFVPQNVHFFTFNDKDDGLCGLAGSAANFGKLGEVFVLGFKGSTSYFDGTPCQCAGMNPLMRKIFWMEHIAKTHGTSLSKVGKDDLLMFVDGFDVIVQGDMRTEVVRLFKKIMKGRRGVLFQGEKNCFPFGKFRKRGGGWESFWGDPVCVHTSAGEKPRIVDFRDTCDIMSRLAPTDGPYRWLNSGGYVGDPVSLLAFFKGMAETMQRVDFLNDQPQAQLVQMLFPRINVKVDSSAEIWFSFQDLNDGDVPRVNTATGRCDPDYILDGMPPRNSLTGSLPMMMHFNGNGKQFLDSCFFAVMRHLPKNSSYAVFDFDRQRSVSCGTLSTYPFWARISAWLLAAAVGGCVVSVLVAARTCNTPCRERQSDEMIRTGALWATR